MAAIRLAASCGAPRCAAAFLKYSDTRVGVASRYDTFDAGSPPSKRAGRRMWSYRPSGMRGTRRDQKALSGGRWVERCHWKLNARHGATDHAMSRQRRFLARTRFFRELFRSATGSAGIRGALRHAEPFPASTAPASQLAAPAFRALRVYLAEAHEKSAISRAAMAEVEAETTAPASEPAPLPCLTLVAQLRNAAPRRPSR